MNELKEWTIKSLRSDGVDGYGLRFMGVMEDDSVSRLAVRFSGDVRESANMLHDFADALARTADQQGWQQ